MEAEVPPFLLWSYLADGCTIAISPYEKYRGGVSVRDVQALVKAVAALARVIPPGRMKIRPAERFQREDWRANHVLIGGRLSNQALRFFTETWEVVDPTSLVLDLNMIRDTLRKKGKDHLVPVFQPGKPLDVENVLEDYGVIVCVPNPLRNQESRIISLSGIKGWGSLAAAEGFSSPQVYLELNRILQGLNFDPQGADAHSVVEIVLWTRVRQPETRRSGVQELVEIKPVLVRINASPERQWESPEFRTAWGGPPKKQQTPRPGYLTLTSVFDHAREKKRSYIELRGPISRYELVETSLSDDLIDRLNTRVSSLDLSRITVQEVAADVSSELLRALPEQLWRNLEVAGTYAHYPQEIHLEFIGPPELLKCPFEMIELARGDYLALRHPISRALIGATRARPALDRNLLGQLANRDGKLRLLLIASDPFQDLPNAQQEIEAIAEVIEAAELNRKVTIDLQFLDTAGAQVEAAREAIVKFRPHLLHYAGHLGFQRDNPERSCLYLTDGRGQPKAVYTAELSDWIKNSPDLAFAYLSACESLSGGHSDRMRRHDFLGVSDALIRAGLPAALGLRWPVQDDSARLLAETFYKTLFVPDLPGLAQALFIARSELASRDRKDPTWLSPILVSHLE